MPLVPATDPSRPSEDLRPGQPLAGECPLCGPGSLRVLPFRYDFRGRYLYGVSCARCSLSFLRPMPTDDEISAMYGQEYFTECSDTCGAHGPQAYMELAETTSGDRRKSAVRLDRRLLRHLEARGDLCEIGCGPGFLLADMRDLGWRVKGLEISDFAARHARETLGLEVSVGSIEEETFPPGSFRAVLLGDVLEHLPRPKDSLQAVRAWLEPGGLVVIAVPSTLNLLSAQLGMGLYKLRGGFKTLRIPPYHLFEYTPPTLRTMLRAAGFTVLAVNQSAVPIRRMGLRGSRVENVGKVSLQLLAHLTSALWNRGGDRLLAIGRKEPL